MIIMRGEFQNLHAVYPDLDITGHEKTNNADKQDMR